MTLKNTGHTPVLCEEVVNALNVRGDGVYVDCTFGRGGHSTAILERLGPGGRLLVIDKDPDAVACARARFAGDGRVDIVHASFTLLDREIGKRGWAGGVHGILFDLGMSSPQLDAGERGFSFLRDGYLDMRFDPSSGIPAAEWLAEAPEAEIAAVIRQYGEERHARRIARAIVRERSHEAITASARLRDLVAAAVPGRERDKHPATRTFQALRIFINRELEELEAALPRAVAALATGGRLAVISFHSLEDRIVKRFMRDGARGDAYPPEIPVTADQMRPLLRLVGKAMHAGAGEIALNPRARSAVLRVAEKVAV